MTRPVSELGSADPMALSSSAVGSGRASARRRLLFTSALVPALVLAGMAWDSRTSASAMSYPINPLAGGSGGDAARSGQYGGTGSAADINSGTVGGDATDPVGGGGGSGSGGVNGLAGLGSGDGGAGGGAQGGAGVYVAGANGSDGSTSTTIGQGGGGGSGGVHGLAGSTLPVADATGGNGGNGGSGNASFGGGGDGGGGGGGGFGAGVIADGALGTLSVNLTGGNGGAGGHGGTGQFASENAGGNGGAGGGGLVLTSSDATELVIAGTLLGGNGGAGGNGANSTQSLFNGGDGGNGGTGGSGAWAENTGTDVVTTLVVTGTVTGGTGGARGALGGGQQPGAFGDYGAGGIGIGGSNLLVSLASTATVSGGLSGDGVTRGNAIQFVDGVNTVLLQGNGAASGVSYATITGNVVGATGAGTSTTLELGGAGGNFDMAGFGVAAQFQDFTEVVVNTTGTWLLSGELAATGTPTQLGIEAGTLQAASAAPFGTATLALQGAGTLQATDTFTLTQAVSLAQVSGAGGGTFSVDDTKTLTLSGVVSGDGNLTKTGTGTLTLSGTNTFTGATAVSAGELVIGGGAALSDTAALTVATGATLTLFDADETVGSLAGAGTVALNGYTLTAGGDNTSTTFSGILSGTGGLTKTGTGVMTLSGANTYSGATTVSGGELVISGGTSLSDTAALTVATGATLTLFDADETVGSLAGAGTVALNSYNLTVGGDNTSTTFSGALSGTGGLIKTGTGTQTLSGTNTYSGATTVSAGELVIAGGASLSDTAALTVATGATLTLSDADETVGSLAGAGTVALNSYTLTAGGDNTSTTFSGILSGTGGLTKTGTGVMTLSGVNTYSGATTVSAGELVISGGSSLSDTAALTVATGATLTLSDADETVGSLAGAGTVALNSYNLITGGDNSSTTFSGALTGTGGLTKTGTGTQTLSGTNTYSGATTVSAGELVIAGGASLSDTAALTVASGATLTLSDADETVGSLAGAGTVALNSYILTAGGDNTSTTFSGVLSGTGGLTKTGTGVMTLSGANTYSGATTVSAGELVISGGSSLSDTALLTVATGATLTLSDADETVGSLAGAGTVALNSYTLTAGGDNTSTTFSGILSGTGGLTKTGTGVMTLSGANTYSGATTVSAGELVISGGSSLSDTAALTVATGATLTLSDADETVGSLAGAGTVALNSYNLITGGDNSSTTFSGALTGTGGLTKTGTGTQTLSGTNTYSGATTVSAGELVIAGGASLSDTAALTVATGATLTLSNADETVGSLTGAGTVALNGYTLTAGGDNTSTTFSGVLSGTGGLTKTGTGVMTLSGVNTYSGVTTVSAGELVISGGSSLSDTAALTVATGATLTLSDADETVGSLAGAGTVALNSYNLIAGGDNSSSTFSGVMTGTGGLTKTGTGVMTLSGANTYSGETTVSAGELVIAGGTSLSDTARLTVASGATLTLSNADETVGSLAGAGTVALNSYNLIAGGDNSSSTFSGVMTGTGGLTKTGTGTLILTGDNTYTGTTVISAGILQIGNGGTTGSLAGDVLNNATLIFNRSDNYTFNGDIGGTGDLKFQGTGRVTLNGTISNDVLVEGGALDLRMGSVNPGTFTVQSGGVLGGTASVGNLVVNAGGIAAPGYSPGTLTVSGTVQFNTGSVYQVDVTPGGAHDLIVAGGAVTLSTGAQVQVLAVPGTYPGVQTFAILTTSSTLTGTFGSVTSDYAFLDPYLSYDLQNVYLTLVYNGETFASYAQTGNQTGVAWAVQALGTGNSLYQALVALPGGAVAPALNQLTGEAYASTQTVILDQSVYLREAVGARLNQAVPAGSGTSALSYAAKAAGPATARLSADWTPTLWMQGYGGWGNAFSDGNAATISSSIGGFFVGLDTPVADHARVGLLGGFSRTNMDVTDRGSSGSIDNYDLGLYAGAKYGMVGLKAGVSYSWHDVSMDRTIAFPGFWGATSAGYTQGTTQVFGEVNTSFAVSSYAFEPFVGLAYVHLSSASTSEGAQTPAALAVDVSGMDTFYTTLGIRAATTVQVGGRTLTPSVTLGWQHAFNDVTPYSTMRFLDGAVPFGVEGVPVAENAAVLGAGLAYALSDKASLQVNYTGQIASSAANNAFTAQFALKF